MSTNFSIASIKDGRSATIRIEDIPEPIRSEALKLDKNADGDLSIGELATAIDKLFQSRRQNAGLRKTIVAFIFLTILLIAGIFGATIAGAILSKDFTVNANGVARVKNSDILMQTTEFIDVIGGRNIGMMTNRELSELNYITINKENLKFYVNGHARDRLQDRVTLLVEGGTITYDKRYIVDATGDAKIMLENVMGLEELYKYPSDRRWLQESDPTEAPVAPTDAPVAPTEAPIAPTDAPVAPTEAPVAPTEAPVAPTDAPIAPTDAPTAPTDAPVAPTDAPTAPTDAPTAPTEAPTTVGPTVDPCDLIASSDHTNDGTGTTTNTTTTTYSSTSF